MTNLRGKFSKNKDVRSKIMQMREAENALRSDIEKLKSDLKLSMVDGGDSDKIAAKIQQSEMKLKASIDACQELESVAARLLRKEKIENEPAINSQRKKDFERLIIPKLIEAYSKYSDELLQKNIAQARGEYIPQREQPTDDLYVTFLRSAIRPYRELQV